MNSFSGIFFVLPCIESYQKVDLRTITLDVPPQEVTLPSASLIFIFQSPSLFPAASFSCFWFSLSLIWSWWNDTSNQWFTLILINRRYIYQTYAYWLIIGSIKLLAPSDWNSNHWIDVPLCHKYWHPIESWSLFKFISSLTFQMKSIEIFFLN